MKGKITLFIGCCFIAVMTSCLGSSNEIHYEGTKNSQLFTFSLKNDSVAGVDSLVFTIDQLSNEVFNLDSMQVGTEIEKALCKMTFGSAVTKARIYQEASGDTIDYTEDDSINVSKPVKLLLYNYMGDARTYDMWINIHTQVPDSLHWSLYSSNILPFVSADMNVITNEYTGTADKYILYTLPQGKQSYEMFTSPMNSSKVWTAQSVSGLPSGGLILDQMSSFNGKIYIPATDGKLYVSPDAANWSVVADAPHIKAIMGTLSENVNQPITLSVVINENGTDKFAAMNKDGHWTVGEDVPSGFPLSGFAKDSHVVMFRDRLLIVGGRATSGLVNTSWSTTDALVWAKLTDDKMTYFSKREGASLAFYDNKYYLIGGIDEKGNASKEIYHSIDNGVTWFVKDTLEILPKEYNARGFASMIVDKDNFINIIGGKTSKNGTEINEHWRGRLNRLGFARQ